MTVRPSGWEEYDMATLTRRKLTPADHGREIDPDEFEGSTGQEGYTYEMIDGRVYVVPVPNLSADDLESWLFAKLFLYQQERPDRIQYLSRRPRVFVHGRKKATRPEPDIAAYDEYPHDRPRRERRWQDVSPFLVVESVSESDPNKDLVRNVALYLEVPSIREYWILDGRADPDRPTLTVYRRRGARWQKPILVPFGGSSESPRILPGFTLVIDPNH